MLPTSIYEFTLPANGSYRLLVAGEYFKLLAADGAVRVQAPWGQLDGLTAGQGLEKTPFSYLYFTDKSGGANAIRVVVGDENFVDGSSGAIVVTQNRIAQSAAFVHVAATVGTASSVIDAANPNRQYLAVQNNHASNSIFVRVDGTAATAATGLKVIPGGSIVFENIVPTAAVHAIGEVAAMPVVVLEG